MVTALLAHTKGHCLPGICVIYNAHLCATSLMTDNSSDEWAVTLYTCFYRCSPFLQCSTRRSHRNCCLSLMIMCLVCALLHQTSSAIWASQYFSSQYFFYLRCWCNKTSYTCVFSYQTLRKLITSRFHICSSPVSLIHWYTNIDWSDTMSLQSIFVCHEGC